MGERRKEHNEKRKRVVQALKTQENVKSAAKCLAPANPQEWASSLILKNKLVTDSSFLMNVLALRSFQISQLTNRSRDRSAFVGTPGVVAIMRHQLPTEDVVCQQFGFTCGQAIQVAMRDQMRFVYLQSASR